MPCGRHALQSKLQICREIRSGQISHREAQRKYALSANLFRFWLTWLHRGEFDGCDAEASVVGEVE